MAYAVAQTAVRYQQVHPVVIDVGVDKDLIFSKLYDPQIPENNPLIKALWRDHDTGQEIGRDIVKLKANVEKILKNFKDKPDAFRELLAHNPAFFGLVRDLSTKFATMGLVMDPPDFVTLFTRIDVDAIVKRPAADTLIARPLKEFAAHVKQGKRVTWELFVRVIKVIVMAIFRGHFFDRVMLMQGDTITYGLKKNIVKEDQAAFKKKYPYLLEKALRLSLKQETKENYPVIHRAPMHSQTVVEYYEDGCQIDVTSKRTGNHVKDLLKSEKFNHIEP